MRTVCSIWWTMGNKLRTVFTPTKEEREEYIKRVQKTHKELSRKKGCSTCIHCIHMINYPGVMTGEEFECNAGLKCDTVLFSVENCPKWENDRGWEITFEQENERSSL